MGSVLIVPVVHGGRDAAVLEVYRILPQAFTAREVDRPVSWPSSSAPPSTAFLKGVRPLYVRAAL
jgi:hypothetical protein